MSDGPRDEDIVELGGGRPRRPGWWPGWRPSRGAALLAVAALAVGLGAGYGAGDSRGGGSVALPTASPSPSSSPPAVAFSVAGSPALTQDIGACSVQAGQQLQLGIQVTNQATEPVALLTAKAVLPLGGLRQVAWQWATCGALPASVVQGPEILMLMPGQSTWLSVSFQVKLQCPGPLPVQFSVGYKVAGHSAIASLPGFPDLSQVPYSGCP